MNTRKTISYGIVVLTALALFAACDNGTTDTHTHDYAAAWKSDATQHWRECTANDGAKTDIAAHTAGDWKVDQPATETAAGSRHKECTVCEYVTETETIPATGVGHTHTYAAAYTHNATQHWRECTANDGAKTDIAAHNGSPCAVCGYTAPANQPPTAHAGTGQTRTLAHNLAITLDGAGSTGNNLTYKWECETYTADQGAVSAEYTPAQATALIADPAAETTTAAPRKAGTYVFKLTVTDDEDESDTDTVTVVVEAGMVTKEVNITFDSFTLPAESISLVPHYEAEWDNDFIKSEYESKITYTITYTFQGDGHTKQYTYPYTDITVAKQTELNTIDTNGVSIQRPWPPALYKQTFYYEGTPLKDINGNDVVYTAYIGVQQVSGTQINWIRLNDSQTNPGENRPDCTPITSLPPTPLVLQLSKTITELP